MQRFPCPSCGEPLIALDGTPRVTGTVLCPHCGQAIDRAELSAAANRTAIDDRITPARAVAAESADTSGSETEVGDGPVPLAPGKARARQRTSRRTIAIIGLAVAVLLFAAGAFTYPLVRDHYNPWLTEKRWELVQAGMTLQQIEAVVGQGKPCSQSDVKAAVDEQDAVFRNHRPLDWNSPSDWDNAVDIANQVVRQGVASWYRWRNGNTLLFVGVNSKSEVRLACLLRQSAGGHTRQNAWRFAVYPYGKGAVAPTGKSAEARLPEEKLVEQYIRKSLDNPAAVEIALWGPHDLKGELRSTLGFQFTDERRQRPIARLRVRYWTRLPDGKPLPNDRFYYLQDGEVLGSYTNPYGDRWMDVLRDAERQLNRGR
jgi:uncharacterized Zn finger protein (UPF0148 family)